MVDRRAGSTRLRRRRHWGLAQRQLILEYLREVAGEAVRQAVAYRVEARRSVATGPKRLATYWRHVAGYMHHLISTLELSRVTRDRQGSSPGPDHSRHDP